MRRSAMPARPHRRDAEGRAALHPAVLKPRQAPKAQRGKPQRVLKARRGKPQQVLKARRVRRASGDRAAAERR